jgi:hypothetical protein
MVKAVFSESFNILIKGGGRSDKGLEALTKFLLKQLKKWSIIT